MQASSEATPLIASGLPLAIDTARLMTPTQTVSGIEWAT